MKKKKFGRKLNKWMKFSMVLSVMLLLTSITALAYFSSRVKVYTNDGAEKHVKLGMSLDLLFDILNPTACNGTPLPTGEEYDSNAEWGGPQNPYIISDIRHLENLSVLQEVGYFNELYIKDNYNVDGSYNGQGKMPYFLICEPDGTPVTIDGSTVTVSPVGNDTFPFVGFLGGAFVDGTTIVNGQNSNVSAVHGLTVQSDTDILDVGLFGTIGFLGVENTDRFIGKVSTVENLVLSDVKIVAKPTLAGTIDATLHRFLFKTVSGEGSGDVPHEDHHIGILVGHVEYANINFISVYYADDSTKAISIDHAGKNYLSTAGIIGFMHEMNPEVDGENIVVGSGLNSADINVKNGTGTGGGLLSGTGRGYVVASELYDMYNGNAPADLRLLDAVDNEGKPLCSAYVRKRLFWGTQTTTKHYFYDGVFTFALSIDGNDCTDKIETTWKNEDGSADRFKIGENNDASWKKNTTEGNDAVVAFVKNIDTEEELQNAIINGKQIYIGYESGNGEISLMSLAEDFSRNDAINKDDNYSTKAITRDEILDQEVIDNIQDTLKYALDEDVEPVEGMLPRDKNGNIIEDVVNHIEDYRLINLGSGSNLTTIKNEYPIMGSLEENDLYSFMGDGNVKCRLAILAVKGPLTGWKYSIFTGTKKPTYLPLIGGKTDWSWYASVNFYDDGTAYIRFDYENKSESESNYRYVYYNKGAFKGTKTEGITGSKLHFYTV